MVGSRQIDKDRIQDFKADVRTLESAMKTAGLPWTLVFSDAAVHGADPHAANEIVTPDQCKAVEEGYCRDSPAMMIKQWYPEKFFLSLDELEAAQAH